MQEKLGRRLDRKEVVHHKDGDTQNNNIDNLELMPLSEHSRMHMTGSIVSEQQKEKLRRIGREQRLTAKLTIEDVRKIRYLLSKGFQQVKIARDYNVHIGTINKIHLGKTWSWVA